MDLGKEIEMIDASSEDFKEQFEFAIWSTGGSSDYRNDRERPYNGQNWTDEGERGKTEVKGLTMRDIKDCLIKAMLSAAPSNKYLNEDFGKCWDFTQEPVKPTQYLLDHQNESDFISTKVQLGTWRPQDVYKINWNDIDPLAIARNLTCEIEKMMNIYPNCRILQYPSQYMKNENLNTEETTNSDLGAVSGWAYLRKHKIPILIGFVIGITLSIVLNLIENIIIKIALIIYGG